MQDVQVKLPPGLVPSVSNHIQLNPAKLMLEVQNKWSTSFTEVLEISTFLHLSYVFLFLYICLVFADGRRVVREGTSFMSLSMTRSFHGNRVIKSCNVTSHVTLET